MRFGLIGCGGIGRLRAAALNRSAPLRLVAVTDVQPERAAAIASDYGGVIDEDWRGAPRPEEGGAGVVFTPPPFHAEAGVQGVESRGNGFFAKPPSRNPGETRPVPAP